MSPAASAPSCASSTTKRSEHTYPSTTRLSWRPSPWSTASRAYPRKIAGVHRPDPAGRRRIVLITGPDDTAVGRERRRGYTEALTLAGLRPYASEPGDFMETGGAAAMRTLLRTHPDLDAVLAANDNMAAGAVRVLRDAGRTVPGDVAVVGFDDLPIALHTDPKLTTIHQPVQALGREAARMLVEVLEGEQPQPFLLPTKVVVRESA
ncbi:LacI family DNA-binding transcriptional regulator [Actinoplanes sp. CA-030573]|uniref:LacI family DNA-binding transcriptional regulator n=1 Tax=Actinoplanes sp. CA-030573 TaxID=3239898 RepID=UPI003D92BB9B